MEFFEINVYQALLDRLTQFSSDRPFQIVTLKCLYARFDPTLKRCFDSLIIKKEITTINSGAPATYRTVVKRLAQVIEHDLTHPKIGTKHPDRNYDRLQTTLSELKDVEQLMDVDRGLLDTRCITASFGETYSYHYLNYQELLTILKPIIEHQIAGLNLRV